MIARKVSSLIKITGKSRRIEFNTDEWTYHGGYLVIVQYFWRMLMIILLGRKKKNSSLALQRNKPRFLQKKKKGISPKKSLWQATHQYFMSMICNEREWVVKREIDTKVAMAQMAPKANGTQVLPFESHRT